MQRGFGGPVFEPFQEQRDPARRGHEWQESVRRDKELTLGTASLMVLGFGLFALCALCFGFGYAVGHHHAVESPSVTASSSGGALAQPSGTTAPTKPSAGQSGAQSQPLPASTAPADADASPVSQTADAAVAVPVSATQTRSEPASGPGESVVRTALPAQPSAIQSTPAAGHVEPALVQSAGTQASGYMVQIASVSHVEDADVLVGALRKRGYAVSARRDPADGLLHVQVGPFADRADALTMRQRLLNDGYNAIVQ